MAQVPHAEPGLVCPLHRKPVEDVCHTCPWWMQLRCVNANTGKDVDSWGCAVGFLPMLMIENAAQTRGAAAATEDARNKIVDVCEGVAQSLIALARGGGGAKVIAAPPP